MSVYLPDFRVIASLVAGFVLSLAPFALVYFVYLFRKKNKFDWNLSSSAAALAVLGVCAGFSGGMSRTSVVGEIVPAVFSFAGVASVYLFGVKRIASVFVAVSVMVFATGMFVGFSGGSNLRGLYDEWTNLRDICVQVYTEPSIISDPNTLLIIDQKFGEICPGVLRWRLS